MDEVKTSKTVKEVFKDYNSNSFVLNAARVIGIDLYKKKNLLEVFIASNKLIDINDVLELEKYMERRFQIQTAFELYHILIPNARLIKVFFKESSAFSPFAQIPHYPLFLQTYSEYFQ